MAHEIKFTWEEDLTDLYACVFSNQSGSMKVRDTTAGAWDTWSDADIDDYDIALTEAGGGLYTATFPSLDAGLYAIVIYQGDKAVPEEILGSTESHWDGTNLVDVASAQPSLGG